MGKRLKDLNVKYFGPLCGEIFLFLFNVSQKEMLQGFQVCLGPVHS